MEAMMVKRIIVVCALLALGLTGCAQPTADVQTANQAEGHAHTEGEGHTSIESDHTHDPTGFLAERAKETTEDSTIAGIIEKIEGGAISLKRPVLEQTVTVQLTSNTKIVQQAEAQAEEIRKGDKVSAFGKQASDVFQAEFVQIGLPGVLSGGGPVSMPLPGSSGQPVPEKDTLFAEGDSVTGTVEQVDGTKITIKSANGAIVTVQLGPNTGIRKQKQLGPEALVPGNFVIANGEAKEHGFEASDLEVLPPPSAP
jgi:hypothetical protein